MISRSNLESSQGCKFPAAFRILGPAQKKKRRQSQNQRSKPNRPCWEYHNMLYSICNFEEKREREREREKERKRERERESERDVWILSIVVKHVNKSYISKKMSFSISNLQNPPGLPRLFFASLEAKSTTLISPNSSRSPWAAFRSCSSSNKPSWKSSKAAPGALWIYFFVDTKTVPNKKRVYKANPATNVSLKNAGFWTTAPA